MCRAVIESSGNKAEAEGLNDGITYLMAFPYILIGGIIYMIYRSTTKKTWFNVFLGSVTVTSAEIWGLVNMFL